MDDTKIAPPAQDYDIEHVEAMADDFEQAIGQWGLTSLIGPYRALRRATVVQADRDALLAAVTAVAEQGGTPAVTAVLNEQVLNPERRAELLRQHNARVAAAALRAAVQAWREDPDALGDTFSDARNWLADRADDIETAAR